MGGARGEMMRGLKQVRNASADSRGEPRVGASWVSNGVENSKDIVFAEARQMQI